VFKEAIEEFRNVLDEHHVVLDPLSLEPYGWCTIPIQRTISAVLRPASVEHLVRIVQIASAHDVALYPISTGRNWGYGAAQPVRDHNIVVDLSRMNQIIEVNSELAYAVVEPGVTQEQLYTHLQQHQIPLCLNPTGAGPGCSILGNTLERGFGIGPNGDHFQAQCGMEVVLATGEVLRTGFGHYAGAKATYLYKWGLGPYLDGLFTQSNFGIVTKIGVSLMPVPEAFEACYFACNSESQLGPLIEGIQQLIAWGTFQGPINLLHRNRALIMLDRYPWDAMANQTPLTETIAAELAAQKRIGMWNGVGALCGSPSQVRAAKRTIRSVLRKKTDRITFLSDRKLQFLRTFPRICGVLMNMNVPDLLKTLEGSYGMLKGIPSEVALPLAYWRNRTNPSRESAIHPARDRCGITWFSPVIPMTTRDVAAFRRIIEPIFRDYQFELCITLTAVNPRCFEATIPLLYDRDNSDEVGRAQTCHATLLRACKLAGYIPYRLGIQSMLEETSTDDTFWKVVQRLKTALDPKGILAPGRYAP
jgi:4-cresol dehydrogenase (hydroxylating)